MGITREFGASPDSFETLEDAMAYRRKMATAVASLPEARQRELAPTFVKQAPDGRWLWKSAPEFLRQRSLKGSESSPALWETLARLAA